MRGNMELKLTEQEIVRREKAENLKSLGIDPFGSRFDRSHNTKTFKNECRNIIGT